MGSESHGDWLTRQMGRRGVSVRQVAEALDVTTKTVYYWRGGKTEINEERLPQLAEVLGISEIEARRGLGFWVPEVSSDDAQPVDDNPYTDPAEREIWKLTELPESERLLYIQLLRERRRTAG